MLKFPLSWNIVELARLRCGLIGSTEYFLSPPSFYSSSHPHGALSGRTSMSGPNVCGFEHHSLSLACCQHSSWFCCQTQPFDQKGLIRARFSPSEAAVFKSRGSIFMSSPPLPAQARLMGTRFSARHVVWQIMRWMALFKHLLPEALQTAPSTRRSLNSRARLLLGRLIVVCPLNEQFPTFSSCVRSCRTRICSLLLCAPWVLGRTEHRVKERRED